MEIGRRLPPREAIILMLMPPSSESAVQVVALSPLAGTLSDPRCSRRRLWGADGPGGGSHRPVRTIVQSPRSDCCQGWLARGGGCAHTGGALVRAAVRIVVRSTTLRNKVCREVRDGIRPGTGAGVPGAGVGIWVRGNAAALRRSVTA